MGELLILLALMGWLSLWTARELDRCGVTRRRASGTARRRRRRDDRADRPGATPGLVQDSQWATP